MGGRPGQAEKACRNRGMAQQAMPVGEARRGGSRGTGLAEAGPGQPLTPREEKKIGSPPAAGVTWRYITSGASGFAHFTNV